ncbi:hypothetical protein F5Y04DRAFT_79493 [Hypomontagnella monticulosa]|nr:hypothetical protein F5Y04DRAFT_79493 [Hypomontagnella monticulosa]
MTMGTATGFSKPNTTAELLEKLYSNPNKQESNLGYHQSIRKGKETSALLALSRSMIKEFCRNPNRLYAAEAAALCAMSRSMPQLSPFTKDYDHSALLNAFIQCIISDQGILDGALIASFGRALHCAPDGTIKETAQVKYGHIVQHITKLLSEAISAASVESQYSLLCTLSELLDVMNDAKFEGISDEKIAQPLFDLLEETKKHSELRLSQAARYAYQGLRGIRTDTSTWEKTGKAAYRTLLAAVAIASSIPSIDPEKLVEGTLDAVTQLGTIAGIIEDLTKTTKPYDGGMDAKQPSSWYKVLRRIDLLIRAKVLPRELESLLGNPDFPVKRDKNFLCGLCALLERVKHDENRNDEIVEVLNKFLDQQGAISKSNRVRQWVELISGHPMLTKPSKIWRLVPKFLHSPRKYSITIGYQESLPQILAGELMAKAWDSCHLVRVFYADQIIRDHYTNENPGRLTVERVSKTGTLPMDKCYINLTVLESNTKDAESAASAQSSLPYLLATFKPEESKAISLLDLQSHSNHQKGKWRVLIRGQAGVGKSTLCKKIVYDYIYHDMWADIIDRVIWLPLRELKANSQLNHTIERLLEAQYFDSRRHGPLLDALHEERGNAKSRTLFILDGLDEVMHLVGESRLLRSLLQEPRAIITTRPYALDRNIIQDIDLEVQTVGFNPEQVRQYIKAVEPQNAAKIQDFLSGRPSIQVLARIPVQLDALCYSFRAGSFHGGKDPQTMTDLYHEVELAMWRKDMVRLEIRYPPGRPDTLSQIDASGMEPEEVLSAIRGYVNKIQTLAFHGLTSHKEEFDWEYQNEISSEKELISHLPESAIKVPSIDFQKISLLRTSDGGRAEHSSYHFLHLTFQEYFAAHYFVQHWPDKKLPGLKRTAEEFLREEKWNQHFNIMWRFVAGLLHDKKKSKEFFDTIEDRPYDLLGSAHLRLIMHCLAEAKEAQDTADFRQLRGNLQDRIMQCFICQVDVAVGGKYIAAEIEFPEAIYWRCFDLPDQTQNTQSRLLGILQRRPIISLQLADYLLKRYLESSNKLLRSCVIELFSYHGDMMPKSYFNRMVQLLEDANRGISGAAALALTSQGDAISEIAGLIKMPNAQVQHLALDILACHSTLPKKTLMDIVALFHDLPQAHAMLVLHRQLSIPEEVILEILNLLQDEHLMTFAEIPRDLREYSFNSDIHKRECMHLTEIIAKQPNLSSEPIMKYLILMLKDRNKITRDRATSILVASPTNVILEALPEIMGLLKHPSESSLSTVEGVLSGHKHLPGYVLGGIVDLLGGSNKDVQSTAANILSHQEVTFSQGTLEQLDSFLDNPNIRSSATIALKGQRSLPERIVQKLLTDFKNPTTRSSQEFILSKQSSFPNEFLEELADWLQTLDEGLQTLASNVLREQPTLPNAVIDKISGMVWSKDANIQHAAMKALSKQSSLPKEILHEIIVNSKHDDRPSSYDIMMTALEHQSPIPPDLLPEILSSLDSGYWGRVLLRRILKQMTDLPDNILKEIMNSLSDTRYRGLEWGVTILLCSQKSDLSDVILGEVRHLFHHPDRNYKEEAIIVLLSQRSTAAAKVFYELVPSLEDLITSRRHCSELDEFLLAQETLPEKTVWELVNILNSQAQGIWSRVSRILSRSLAISDERFVSWLHKMDDNSFTNLYRFWLAESFNGFATWRSGIKDTDTVLTVETRTRNIPLNGLQDKIDEARRALNATFLL